MKRKFKCRECNAPCFTEGGRCSPCYMAEHKSKLAADRAARVPLTPEQIKERNKANNNKGVCADCGKTCGTYSERCKECSVIYSKGKSKRFAAPNVDLTETKPVKKLSFSDWLKKRDETLHGMLRRLKRDNPEHGERALKGILENIAAQKLNAQKSGVSLRIDTDPIREILTDAKSGKFYFEDNEGFCPPMSLYRFEVYYTV